MNYYIDFEAAQYSLEIIEIGMCDDNGNCFEYLVKSKRGITPFITQLTGITPDIYNEFAISIDDALKAIYKLISKDNDPHFYCWGNSDVDFLKHTMKNCETFQSKSVLSLMAMCMNNSSADFKSTFGLYKDMRLWDVFSHIQEETGITTYTAQTHRALDDARMLKEVYNYYLAPDAKHSNPFPAYTIKERERLKKANNLMISFGNHGYKLKMMGTAPAGRTIIKDELSKASINTKGAIAICKKGYMYALFSNMNEAINFIIEHGIEDRAIADPTNIAKKIRTAYLKNALYFNAHWIICDEELAKQNILKHDESEVG